MIARNELGMVLGRCGIDDGVYCSEAGFQAQVRRGQADVRVQGHHPRIFQMGIGFEGLLFALVLFDFPVNLEDHQGRGKDCIGWGFRNITSVSVCFRSPC